MLLSSCGKQLSDSDKDLLKKEIADTEQAFNVMLANEGVAVAFHYFAAEDAVISRGRDSLIYGKEGIMNFYSDKKYKNAEATWKPDFIDISEDGTMAYTYGKYTWTVKDTITGDKHFSGVFHTVWKKMKDGNWKYVWD
jgi:ketosteroid isomerase-like protein